MYSSGQEQERKHLTINTWGSSTAQSQTGFTTLIYQLDLLITENNNTPCQQKGRKYKDKCSFSAHFLSMNL